ncbi:dihydropteroate synthase [Boudabousia tangfeifanii]|uniref:Dihydropteroate synthase n=1 Tax=Boudabousia tangfeifanii TaxID=1912795 RepID=A0A1D9MLD8_9ACTO|nr:dihydropteroate synthase [Boudabousia tangfeifanii]AOZ73181.1 dihydropteroate synthase [Boudabousia tangfeifanii]
MSYQLENLVKPTAVMGILNVTPDSFSDGGRHFSLKDALAGAERLLAEGATLIDVGGESTRPGSTRIPSSEEQDRIMPVIKELVAGGAVVSVDTLHADTAAKAIEAGAQIINDVSGGLYDDQMGKVVAGSPAYYICQHWRGTPDTMDQLASYEDVTAEVKAELDERLAELFAAGVVPEQIILDPGLGFAKNPQQCWQLLAQLPELQAMGYPILIGASRKRFVGQIPGVEGGPTERDLPTAVISAWCAQHQIWAVRVHDVRSSVIAINTVRSMLDANSLEDRK